MINNIDKRKSEFPISFDGMSVVDVDDIDGFSDFSDSPTLNYAVEIDGRSLGELEAWSTSEGNKFRIQDPEKRDNEEQVEQVLSGYAGEMAVMFLSDELELPIDWLNDDYGHSCDALLSVDNDTFSVEIKTAQMSSIAQNVPLRGDYDDTPKKAWEKEGELPDILIHTYVRYTGTSLVVAVEGCEPFDESLRGILYREPESKFGGSLWVYDREYIRHGIENIDSVLVDKLRR